jgi:hypothetical protein
LFVCFQLFLLHIDEIISSMCGKEPYGGFLGSTSVCCGHETKVTGGIFCSEVLNQIDYYWKSIETKAIDSLFISILYILFTTDGCQNHRLTGEWDAKTYTVHELTSQQGCNPIMWTTALAENVGHACLLSDVKQLKFN